MARIGVDLGGTKTEVIALDDDGTQIDRRRIATPRDDYESLVSGVARFVLDFERELGVAATIGFGTPGAISPATGTIKNANLTMLNGRSLDRDLARALGRDIRMANDADCLALSEATDGAAAGAGTVFAVILGTGVGGGVVAGGRLLQGPNAIAGEWGHNPLPWPDPDERPGPACYCGLTGCIETYLSGPGMSADYARATGSRLDPPAIVAAAATDTEARHTVQRYVGRLARALATVINLLDPHVVVLAGGMSNIAGLATGVQERWGDYVFSDRVDTRLVPALHGDSSGVRGAAWLWGPD